MDVMMLSRIQFGFTATFHYLFPPMTIGLSWMIVIIEGLYLKTGNKIYKQMAQFWVRIFSLFFAMGVATGFVLVFAFGNNWSTFSKFVGDVFGTLLAAEGVFAFFLEGGFLGIMLFGWDRVKPWVHYLSTILVTFGATFSATWIVMANSWMQTPAGYKIIGEGANKRAVITSLWDVYFNPSFVDRLIHVLLGCWLVGIFIMVSVGAYYMLRKKHVQFSKFTLKLSLVTAFVALILQLISADSTAKGVAKNQPVKLAAMEGVYETKEYTPFTVIGILDEKNEKVYGISIPGLLSFLTYHDFKKAIPGLNDFPKENWPSIPAVFYSYHVMVYAWFGMMLIAIIGLILWKKNRLEVTKWFLWGAVFSVLLPYVANTAGWFTAEFGRQPWIVYNVMRTVEGASKVVNRSQVMGSLIMFGVIYSLLFALFIFLLNRKIQHGPVEDDGLLEDKHYRQTFSKGADL
jgi:cytochrome d ubiquinol oxidase subunit I